MPMIDFGTDASLPSKAKDWALYWGGEIFCEHEMIHMGWTDEHVLNTLSSIAYDFIDEAKPEDNPEGMREWLGLDLTMRTAIVRDVMKVLAEGVYRQPYMHPRLTMNVRHYLSMMGGWWPEGVGGAPLTDHSMFGDGEEILCRCCEHRMGRQEEFRVIVYGMLTEKKTVFTKVPICWSCLKGGRT